jgi:hypothetical protein
MRTGGGLALRKGDCHRCVTCGFRERLGAFYVSGKKLDDRFCDYFVNIGMAGDLSRNVFFADFRKYRGWPHGARKPLPAL